jgi:hypothetical protein
MLHLSVSAVNCKRVTYLSLMSEGDIRIATTPTLEIFQAPSQYSCHGVSALGPQYNLRLHLVCNKIMTLLFSKYTTCLDNSVAHFLIMLEQSQFMSFNGWFVRIPTL